MLMELDFQSDTPIYLQLKTQLIEGIATGKLKPGESLPSVRQFAEDLGINMHTVNKTYNLLKQDGFILVHRQKGVVVNPDGPPPLTEEYLTQLQSELRPLIIEAYCRGIKEQEFHKICSDLFTAFKKNGGKK